MVVRMATQRTSLSRDAILSAAIDVVDQHGLGALSMRRLGELLGVEAMSLYYYVNGREDLLEGMVATLVDQVRVPPREEFGPANGWQAFLQHIAHAVRRIAVEHPQMFPLVATRPPAAPWLRPPLRSLRLVEDFLEGLHVRGLEDEQATWVYKTFASFLLGHLLLEVSQHGAETGPDSEPLDEGDAVVPAADQNLSLERYPTVLRLRDALTRHDSDAEFEQALEHHLDHLDAQLSQ